MDSFTVTFKIAGLTIGATIGLNTVANALHLPKDHPLDVVFFAPKGMLLSTSSTASTMTVIDRKP